METFTQRQLAILNYLRDRVANDGHPPTLAEIAAAFGFRQPRSAQDHLRALEAKGVLELSPGKARGIRLVEDARPSRPLLLQLPLVGRVAAGKPILADANVEKHIGVEPSLFHPKAHYLLRVQGESMRDVGIVEGDLIAVHRTGEARNGQIVVARIEDEVTVKRFQRVRNKIQLLPENSDFKPITVDSRSAFAIEGVYVGLLRTS